MIQAKLRFATFEEYLAWSDGLKDAPRYELIDGELIELPPEAEPNTAISLFFCYELAEHTNRRLLKPYTCEVQVRVLEPKDAQNRYPDLVVLREEHLQLTQRRLTIKLDMPPPRLVIEVVSPGARASNRDYIRKRAQYADIGISEYWIIDPKAKLVIVLSLSEVGYVELGTFSGEEAIASREFPELQLTPDQIFAAAM